MKHVSVILSLMLALCLCFSAALAEGETDAVSSASVADFYGQYGLSGDELMNALNSFSGTYLLSTVNPDGTPNCAFFIYGCVKLDDKYYAQLGLAENQSRQNILRTGEAVAVYAANPTGEADAKPFAVAGARMTLKVVTDEELLSKLNTAGSETVIFAEMVEVKPLG